jgi:hypothetical protein
LSSSSTIHQSHSACAQARVTQTSWDTRSRTIGKCSVIATVSCIAIVHQGCQCVQSTNKPCLCQP